MTEPLSGPSGILNINKPAEWTSHDVVAVVRSATGQRKIGHAGTLDPLATGVLVLCLGGATKLVDYLADGKKVYHALIRLGITTDTYDSGGTVTGEAATEAIGAITLSDIERVVKGFTGAIRQVPPMYSAIKQKGQHLYTLARKGIEVEREARPVEIYSIDLLSFAPPFLELRITCSKGTYIRSLAHDIGQALGTGAHLAGLEREASGRFRAEQAIGLDEFRRRCAEGTWHDILLPIDEGLLDLDVLILTPASIRKIKDGIYWKPCIPRAMAAVGTRCRAYSTDGRFCAILERYPSGWWLGKLFVE